MYGLIIEYKMKIATWNIARHRKGSDKMNSIIDTLLEQDADILVLTVPVSRSRT